MGEAVLKELARAFNCPDITHLDIHAIRAGYAELMDEAADAVHAAGLEQDDCTLERRAEVTIEPDGEKRSIHVDMLSDPQRCIHGMLEQCAGTPASCRIAIERLKLRIVRGAHLDPFGLASPRGGRAPDSGCTP